MQKNKIKAFTLAEILITLGILGVVAILVIPAMFQNTQQREFETGYKKAVNTINQALLAGMTMDSSTPYENPDLFQYLLQHMSVMKTTTSVPYKTYTASNGTEYDNAAFYTVDGIRYEFAKSGAKTNLVLHENSGNVCIATFIDPDSDEEGCGGCGSLGLTNNKNGTTKPPCIITVDVNGERKPTPGNVNCMDSNCAKKENVYKTPGPNEKNLRDIFSIMVTEDKAIPFGVVAQKVMYNARN